MNDDVVLISKFIEEKLKQSNRTDDKSRQAITQVMNATLPYYY